MDLKTIEIEVDDNIGTIFLNRPQRMNAWTGRMHTEYRWALEKFEQDSDVRVIVVTGRGKGFCVGADTKALEGHAEKGAYDPGTPDTIAEPGYGVNDVFDASFAYHFGLTKPVIAAINGPAAGVGLVLACYADLRFAVPGAKLTTAHGKLNLPAEYGLSWLLPRLIGVTKANDLLLSSRIFLTEEADQLGLLNGLVEPDQLMSHVYDYARKLKNTVSPGSLATTKRQIYSDLHRDVRSSVEESDVLIREMMKQKDYLEGVNAFMERRPANWQGE